MSNHVVAEARSNETTQRVRDLRLEVDRLVSKEDSGTRLAILVFSVAAILSVAPLLMETPDLRWAAMIAYLVGVARVAHNCLLGYRLGKVIKEIRRLDPDWRALMAWPKKTRQQIRSSADRSLN